MKRCQNNKWIDALNLAPPILYFYHWIMQPATTTTKTLQIKPSLKRRKKKSLPFWFFPVDFSFDKFVHQIWHILKVKHLRTRHHFRRWIFFFAQKKLDVQRCFNTLNPRILFSQVDNIDKIWISILNLMGFFSDFFLFNGP